MTSGVKTDQKGFTIVELMIAIMVFSLLLLVCSAAIIHIGRMYYKGGIVSRTQEATRTVTEDVAQVIQFTSANLPVSVTSGSTRAWCIGEVRYTFHTTASLGSDTGQSPHVLWKDANPSIGSCSVANLSNTSLSGGVEMVGENMRVPVFEIVQNGDLWDVTIRVAYGKEVDGFTDSTYAFCKGVINGGQFCAVSDNQTSVVKRLR